MPTPRRHLLPLFLLAAALGCSSGLGDEAATGDVLVLDGLPAETGFDATFPAWTSLDGTWQLALDPDDAGLGEGWEDPSLDRGGWGEQAVPGTFNRDAGGALAPYEGVAWYAREFQVPALADDRRLHLRFGACFLDCTFWLNGTEIGHTDRPYLPLHFDATGAAREGDNTLVVRVDSRIGEDTVPVDTLLHPGSHGWWPYGGLTRGVTMEVGPRAWVHDLTALPDHDGAPGALRMRVGVFVAGDDPVRVDEIELRLTGPGGGEPLVWEAFKFDLGPGLHRFVVDHTEDGAQRWSRADPALYEMAVAMEADDFRAERVARFGFREVAADEDRVWVDDDGAFLYAVSRHEDDPRSGPWQDDQHLADDATLLVALGANHIRPGHYPADERWLRILRDAGITVAEEIPVYQWDPEQMADPALVDRARTQLRAMIQRDRNNPAIVMWSLMNEVHSWAPEAGEFAAELDATAKADDPDRLTTAALLAMPGAFLDEQVAGEIDVIGLNEYYGWYYQANEDVVPALDATRAAFPGKPIVVSEFGAGAVLGQEHEGELGPEPLDDHQYSEAWQAWYLDEHMALFQDWGGLAGVQPWAWADFHMEWNPTTGDPHPVEHTNLKGLLTMDRQPKQSYEAVQTWFTDRALGE